jgi:acyl dehydratase
MKKLVLSLAVAFAAPAFAGSTTGTIVDFESNSVTGMVTVTMSTTPTGGAVCGSGNPTKYVYDGATTAAGRMAHGDVTTAKALGQVVKITGLGTCLLVSGHETLSLVKPQ